MSLSLISKNLRKYPVLVVCGIIVPLSLVLLMMRAPKIADYEGQLMELEKEWSNIQTNVERSNGLQEDMDNLNAGLARIRERLMQVDEVASNYEFFYGLEHQAGVSVDRFSIGLPSDGSNLPLGRKNLRHFSVIPCDVAMKGTIQEVLRFLDLLDRQEFIVRMDLLDVSRLQAQGADPDQLNARLRCYVLAAKTDA